ncbi:MAG: hypothetical protein KF861_20625, partial [Planctomycetaceae bacterium]|nr:hypothetical protein [Planctomycetaceae bacterium]
MRSPAVVIGILCVVGLGPSSASAQLPMGPAPGSTATTDSARRPAGAASPDGGRVIFRQDANGHWQPVPLADVEFDHSPNRGDARRPGEPEIPDFFVSKLQLDGTATDGSIKMTADVTVEVVTPDRWLRVPLRFDQALLLDYQHKGSGEAAPDAARNANEGLAWFLYGAGEHQLKLSLRVPLRKTPDGEQLQIQLPDLRPFSGELNLRIPSRVTFREGVGVRLTSTRTEGDFTIGSADLTGERCDLRWNVVLQPTESITLERMEMALQLKDASAELAAHQEIRFRSGQTDALQVRLPSGDFQLDPQGVRVRDKSGNDRLVQPKPLGEQPAWVAIPLEGVVGNVVELDWRFNHQSDLPAQEIVIDGLEVAGTPQHNGTITIDNAGGFRVSRVESGEVGIKRIDVNERAATAAYAFSGAQYRLPLQVEPVAPLFSVTPYYFLLVSPDRVELEAAFQVHVDEGNVRTVPIHWPESTGTPWAVVNASLLTAGELRSTPGSAGPRDQAAPRWMLQLPDLIDRQAVVGLSAAYFFGFDGTQDTTSFSLPTVLGGRMLPGWVIVSTADNVEAATRPQSGTMLTRQDGSLLSTRGLTWPEWTNTQPQTVYRVTTKERD